eukprot:1052422-Amphidinium_carterae.2
MQHYSRFNGLRMGTILCAIALSELDFTERASPSLGKLLESVQGKKSSCLQSQRFTQSPRVGLLQGRLHLLVASEVLAFHRMMAPRLTAPLPKPCCTWLCLRSVPTLRFSRRASYLKAAWPKVCPCFAADQVVVVHHDALQKVDYLLHSDDDFICGEIPSVPECVTVRDAFNPMSQETSQTT